jgi:hypothetical protein
LYDPEDRNFIQLTISQAKIRRLQKGFREQLLCARCESIINTYEKHARRLFADPLPTPLKGSQRIFPYPQLDYRLSKLFMMSLAWRASISSLDVFRQVRLGPYTEEFRHSLLNGTVPHPTRFGCIIFRVTLDGERFDAFMNEPTIAKIEGRTCYRFVQRGFLFVVFGSPSLPAGFERLCITDSSPPFVLNSDFFEHRFLAKSWDAVAALNIDL